MMRPGRLWTPACGSGTLLVAAYRQKRELYAGSKSGAELHRQFVEKDLIGINVMAFVAHLAAVHLAIQEPLEDTDRVQIGVDDSTRKSPGDVLQESSRALREMFKQRTLVASEDSGLSPGPDGGRHVLHFRSGRTGRGSRVPLSAGSSGPRNH